MRYVMINIKNKDYRTNGLGSMEGCSPSDMLFFIMTRTTLFNCAKADSTKKG